MWTLMSNGSQLDWLCVWSHALLWEWFLAAAPICLAARVSKPEVTYHLVPSASQHIVG